MNKFFKALTAVFVFALVFAPMAVFAQDAAPAAAEAATNAVFSLSTIGAAFVIIGAAYGIGRIGSTAVESMSRQPEIAGAIQTAMIIAAALIEGIAFFALIICLMK